MPPARASMHVFSFLTGFLSPRLLVAAASLFSAHLAVAEGSVAPASGPRTLTLDQCLDLAWQQNQTRPASRFALAAAEAQHRQSLAGYWPQLSLRAGYELLDEYRNFVFPPSTQIVPPQSVNVPAGTALITVPAGVLGPTAIQLPVTTPAQLYKTDAQLFPVPEQNVKLGDRATLAGSVDLAWLLFDGGMRAGLRTQARAGVTAASEAVRRTDLEITETVTRLYYGAVLARQLRQLGADTLERMNSTLQLTESLYKESSGSVTKSDYLGNKVMVESIRAMVATLEKNEALSAAALANSLGLSWQESVIPADRELPFTASSSDLPALVGQAYEFNPDWRTLEAGLLAAEGAIQHARSGRAPQLALTGSIHRVENEYEYGYMSERNKRGWTAGLGIRLPLFDGHLTRERIAAARARLGELQQKRFLLREGLGLQLKQIVLELDASAKAHAATLAARAAAEEDRDLNTRAYVDNLVETEKVIRAQLIEALMTAQHLKSRYDHVVLQNRLNLLVGSEVRRSLGDAPSPSPSP